MRTRRLIVRSGLALACVALGAGAEAGLALQKKAKESGIESVQTCQSCHVDKLPKKDSPKLNHMGQWLVDQKAARKAKEIDVTWLKEYKPPAK